MQIVSACWRENERILRAEGLTQNDLQQTWTALAGYVQDCVAQKKGVRLPGICKLLIQKHQVLNAMVGKPGGLMVVLSDKLLARFPRLQLGSGLSLFAAVKDQVQGTQEISHIKLAQRCKVLNRDAVQSMLKLFTNTIVYFIERQQSLTVDLGAGQLIFKAGRIVEFKPSSSQFSPVTANTVETNSDSSKGSSLTAAMLSQLGPGAAGVTACKSSVSKVSRASRAPAASVTRSLCGSHLSAKSTSKQLTTSCSKCPATQDSSAANSSSSRSKQGAWPCDGLPDKPSNTLLSPNDFITARIQARAAAVANARIKPATFVLPAGAPGEVEQQRQPQGKGRPGAAGNLAQDQVLEAAAVRHQQEEAMQASAEAQLRASAAALKEKLDREAQALAEQQAANKRRLAETLAQQVRERQSADVAAQSAGGALVLGTSIDEAVQRRQRQQAAYRAALDQQVDQKAQLRQQQKAEEAARELQELDLARQSIVTAAQASISSKKQAAATVRQQLDLQMTGSQRCFNA